MSTLTDLVASVVVHSSAAALSHFGVQVEPNLLDRPAPVERVVTRTPKAKADKAATRVADCPDTPRRTPAASIALKA